jgi:DNA-binding response OmpR family regulator
MLHDRPVLTGSTVLVAEDEAIVALELEATLRLYGCAVLGPAFTVAEGLVLLARETPHAALVNARLQDGSALPLVTALRAAGVPVGLATGYGAGELEEPLRKLPVLSKPHHPFAVLTFVGQLTRGGHPPSNTASCVDPSRAVPPASPTQSSATTQSTDQLNPAAAAAVLLAPEVEADRWIDPAEYRQQSKEC